MLFAIGLPTAIGGVVTAVWYWRLRQTGVAALIDLYTAKGKQLEPASERYWSVDKRAKCVALVNMTCWAICILGLGLLDRNQQQVPWVWQRLLLAAPAALSLCAMVIVAEIYNNRESTERWKHWKPR